jgi:OPT family oligopeptide transporter
MAQCLALLSDLKLGHYMKIPPRAMFLSQIWGTIVGGVFNYVMMIVIINAQRDYLDGSKVDQTGLWSGYQPQIFWGSALIFGALGPRRMFAASGNYSFVFYGFLVGIAIPIVQWGLSKKFPKITWSKVNLALIANGMSNFPNGQTYPVLVSLIVCVIFQYWVFRYHKNWWSKYVFILSAALDTGAAFTGLVVFFFLGGGISPTLEVKVPSWWANYHTPTGSNAPYLLFDRCGASGNWTGGLLKP